MFQLENAQSLVGLGLILLVCWALSEDRSRFPWRLALGAVALQVVLVVMLFGLPGAQAVVRGINAGVDGLAAATAKGTQFVFGYMAGGAQPYPVQDPGALFIFAFQVLPLILVISALSALLWHWKILKWITQGFGFVFQKTMGLGGASALAVAVNIFLGMIESPIVIRAYLDKLTRSEVFLMIVVGLATVAGSTRMAGRRSQSISWLRVARVPVSRMKLSRMENFIPAHWWTSHHRREVFFRGRGLARLALSRSRATIAGRVRGTPTSAHPGSGRCGR